MTPKAPRLHWTLRLLLALGVAGLSYFAFYRPRQLVWGATREEILRTMPGDDIVAKPSFIATRALTIAAAPERIWPWLVQMGVHRAGWYSYDLVDNLARPSADRIVPELQRLEPGGLVPMSPNGKMGFLVREVRPGRGMLWWDGRSGRSKLSWAWELLPLDPGRTRLITRIRLQYRWLSPEILFYLPLDAGDFVMMRQCLLGIRTRAEGRKSVSLIGQSLELLAWLALFAAFVTAEVRLVRGRHWPGALAAALIAAVVTILFVLWKPPLWLDLMTVPLLWGCTLWLGRKRG